MRQQAQTWAVPFAQVYTLSRFRAEQGETGVPRMDPQVFNDAAPRNQVEHIDTTRERTTQ